MKLRNLFAVAIALATVVTLPARAEVPEPTCVEVTPWDGMNGVVLAPPPTQGSPVPGTVGHVIIRSEDCNPIAGASVVVLFGADNVICGSAVLTGTTGADGSVDVTLPGGGCAHDITFGCVIKANGVTVRNYQNAKSPDYDGAGGNLEVNVADLIVFGNEFTDVTTNECHDYDNDGNTGLSDLIVFSSAFARVVQCP